VESLKKKAQRLQNVNCMYIMQFLHTGFILRNAWRHHLQLIRWLPEDGYPRSKHVRVLQNFALTNVNTLMKLLFIDIQDACLVVEPVQGVAI